jgi:hypothetical protein
MNKLKRDKRGQILGMVLIVGIIFLVLIVGFILVSGGAVLNYVFDEVVPELTGLGMVGDANMTAISVYTITPVNNIVQSLNWMTGVLYVMLIIGCFGLAFVMRISPSKWLIGFYFLLSIILIIGSIFISNIYQDFYDDGSNSELAIRMNENVILSYMMLYAPIISTILVFVSGIIIFSGRSEEEAYV